MRNTMFLFIGLSLLSFTTSLYAKKTLPTQCLFYFKMYVNAKAPKAFAYAVDSNEKVTCRFSASSKSQKRADEVALFSCQKSSIEKGIMADCQIYKPQVDHNTSLKKLSFEEKYSKNLKAIKTDIAESLKKHQHKKALKHVTTHEKKPLKKKVLIPKKKTIQSIKEPIKKEISTLPKPCHLFYRLYQKAALHKAFAIAIDDEKHYACKYSARSTTPLKAKEVALHSCEKSRKKRAIKTPCRLYIAIEKRPKKTTVKTKKPQKKISQKTQIPASNPALEHAILTVNLPKIKRLITQGGDVNTKASDNSRALFVAVSQGDIPYTKKLFLKGAYPFFRKKDGNNLLVAAIMSGKNEMLKLILNHNLDPNIGCEDGNTPLHFALMMFDDAMIKTLLSFGARDDIKNQEGKTVKDLAKAYHVNLKRLKR